MTFVSYRQAARKARPKVEKTATSVGDQKIQKDEASSPHLMSGRLSPKQLSPIAQVIDYLVEHANDIPDLNELAGIAGLSPTHFQKRFKQGTGVSPKRFLQRLTAQTARISLHDGASILEAAHDAGLSGPSRLHDLFLHTEAMTPGAYKKRGAGEVIRYGVVIGPFGHTLIGATDKGICWLSFPDAEGFERGIQDMKADWPAAEFIYDEKALEPIGQAAFQFALGRAEEPLSMHMSGTNFQIKVWEALLSLPAGATTTYGAIADMVCTRKASRAVGTAVGANPISLLIPCHRVIKASGAIHNYRWGAARKRALLALEACQFPEQNKAPDLFDSSL
ncbi:MAG: methylated-DNA--[protein]-cysteine S-methyltransferase [Pseudomonadota bacterium]